MTANKIITVAIVVLLSFAMLGCSANIVKFKSQTPILYAKRDAIYEYKKGESNKLFNNPAGYDSLDGWLGYSKSSSRIVFKRSVYWKLMAITHIDSRNPNVENLHYASKEWLDNPGCSLINDMFYQIRGQYNCAALWKCSKTQKWSRLKSWTISRNIPLPKKWISPPALIKNDLVFVTPSGYLVKVNKKTDAVVIISDGNSTWVNDEDEDEEYLSSWQMPSVSNNGRYIAWRPRGVADGTIRIVSIDGNFRKDYEAVNGIIALIHWLDDKHLVCEELSNLSGLSRLYIVDKDKSTSDCILSGVERHQWCVVK